MNADTLPPLIRLDRVYIGFSGIPLFRELSLSIYAGHHLALIGPNASGKSTLLRLIQGEIRPMPNLPPEQPGRILYCFDGHREDRSVLNARQHVRTVSPALQRNYARRGWIISGKEILLSGLDNAAMLYGEPPAGLDEQAADLAAQAGASHLLGMPAPAMSQGQLRLALMLRALISRPALLLLDEPFDGLDGHARRAVSRSIALAMAQGSTVLVSAHRLEDIPEGINEALVINSGKLSRRPLNPLETLFSNNDAARYKPVAPKNASGSDAEPAATRQQGRKIACADAPLSPFVRDILSLDPDALPLFQLSGVDVFIDREHVLRGINWSVRKGERWALSGSNGSGKSTLLRLLCGEEFAAYGGNVLWCGKARPPLEELRRGVGYVSDRLQDGYDYELSAEEIVISGFRGNIGLYEEPSREERALARAWLTRLGLGRIVAAPFFSLSGGVMRRVLLARAMVLHPPVLLLDEPCSGLDASGRALFLRSLEEAAMNGLTLIYASHREQELGPLFTHELKLEAGRVLFSGPFGLKPA